LARGLRDGDVEHVPTDRRMAHVAEESVHSTNGTPRWFLGRDSVVKGPDEIEYVLYLHW